jgi:hypothetical protein
MELMMMGVSDIATEVSLLPELGQQHLNLFNVEPSLSLCHFVTLLPSKTLLPMFRS